MTRLRLEKNDPPSYTKPHEQNSSLHGSFWFARKSLKPGHHSKVRSVCMNMYVGVSVQNRGSDRMPYSTRQLDKSVCEFQIVREQVELCIRSLPLDGSVNYAA